MKTIALTMEEQKRVEVIQRVFRGEMAMGEAAMVLGVCERHSYRIKAQTREEGVKGAIHGNRGRSCDRKRPVNTHRRIVVLERGNYRGFNDHHLSEKMADEEGIKIPREKVRRALRAEGLPSPRNIRPPRHRSRRERRGCEGMMLQVDGSPHDWLEGRGPYFTLVGAIDDATGKVPGAFFVEAESSWSYLELFFGVFKKKGLPQSVYSDRHSIFLTHREPTIEEQLEAKRPRTQIGRALEELGINSDPCSITSG